MPIKEFEDFVFGQKQLDGSAYDDSYFTDAWREGENDYRVETRRKIEGRNPRLIKEVFAPTKVLDVGCGPGALMFLLFELGVIADGLDLSDRSREIAPPEVRDRIIIGSITHPITPANAYDLVICREVLEHLTVLQIKQAVACICRTTSKYVYVTTRFHPAPSSLLSVTTQFDVDPTHITLLNKDFLRLLFVLEGLRSRPDLEAKMDWADKGRVLVYEKLNTAC